MKVSPLLIPVAALAWSPALAAQVPGAASPSGAPSAAPAETQPGAPSAAPAETRSPGGASSSVAAALRVGVIGGVGFPRPLAIEGMAEISGIVALGLEYGTLPVITIDGVSAGLWSVAGDLRVFPLRGGAFFIGLRGGRQHVGATTTIAIGSLGSAAEVLDLDSWFVNPRVGFLWTTREGFTFGVEAGVQVPLGPTLSSTLPLSLSPTAQRTVDTLGKSVLPTVDLLRVGLLL